MSDRFADKVTDELDNGQSCKHNAAVEDNTTRTVHQDSQASKLDTDKTHQSESENVAAQFYVINTHCLSMSPQANGEIGTAGHAAVFHVSADLQASSSVSNKTVFDYASRQETGNKVKDKTYLDRKLDTLDKSQAVKVENITESYRDTKKIDLANKDVNSNRPAVLGPSRFDSSSYTRTSFTSHEQTPRRNTSSQGRSVIKEPEPVSITTVSSKNGITKSFTTADLMSPSSRRRFDTNFNAMPEPFKPAATLAEPPRVSEREIRVAQTSSSSNSSDYFSRDPQILNYGGQRNYSSYSSQVSPISSLQLPASYVCPPLVTTVSTVTASSPPSSSMSSSSLLASSLSSRARSEGNGQIISATSQYKDFYNQIQVTKDRYKSDREKAMSFDKTAIKPPIIRDRLPRPDNSHATLGRDRRLDREATVVKTIEGARRGKSDDMLRSTSFRY